MPGWDTSPWCRLALVQARQLSFKILSLISKYRGQTVSLPNARKKMVTSVQSVSLCIGNKTKYCENSQFHSPMYLASDAEVYKSTFQERLLIISDTAFLLLNIKFTLHQVDL